LKRRILSGQYDQGQLAFTGEALEKEFEASNITIRKALEMLTRDGFVNRRRGLGTTVSEGISEPVVFELGSSFRKLVESIEKMKCRIKVMDIVTIKCPKHVQNILSLSPEQEVWRMRRVRIYKDMTVSFYTYYANPVSCGAISMKGAKKVNIIDTFEQASGMKIARIKQIIRSAVADLDISVALKIPFGAPVFFLENIYYSVSDKVLLCSQSYYRADMFAFKSSTQL
jgi:DNA-binding GntR family transcriptional regulator